jgi:hypothetical protein
VSADRLAVCVFVYCGQSSDIFVFSSYLVFRHQETVVLRGGSPKTARIPEDYCLSACLYVRLSVAGKILTFSPSHPPLINSFPRDEIFFFVKKGKKLMGYFQTAKSGA